MHPPPVLCRRTALGCLILLPLLGPIAGRPAGAADVAPAPAGRPTPPTAAARGAGELYWVPTLEQALAMADATGRPRFLLGFSLVGNGSTYTKLGPEYCTGVY